MTQTRLLTSPARRRGEFAPKRGGHDLALQGLERARHPVRHHPPLPWSVDGKTGSTLVVTKLGKDDACHVAYVEAAGNPKANEQARAHADTLARGFDCKRDVPKHHGADGSLTD